jgi:hypothetical protein
MAIEVNYISLGPILNEKVGFSMISLHWNDFTTVNEVHLDKLIQIKSPVEDAIFLYNMNIHPFYR